jgi:hypothetical protein
MTLHEIEETLATLESRHGRLDEAMLVTLLRAGGWEEKDIEDAKTLFEGRGSSSFDTVAPEAKALPDGIDPSHLLMDHNEGVPQAIAQPPKEPQEEPSSLIVEQSAGSGRKEELPHNLPLRPFETSEHVWPFSRYKDVFYGDTDEAEAPAPSPVPAPVPHAPIPVPVQKEHVFIPASPPPQSTPPLGKTPILNPYQPPTATKAKGEDRLVMLASVMLLAILLLLGYMYKNGRL